MGQQVQAAGQHEPPSVLFGQVEEPAANADETVEILREIPADLHQEVQHVVALDTRREALQPPQEASDLLHQPDLGQRRELPLLLEPGQGSSRNDRGRSQAYEIRLNLDQRGLRVVGVLVGVGVVVDVGSGVVVGVGEAVDEGTGVDVSVDVGDGVGVGVGGIGVFVGGTGVLVQVGVGEGDGVAVAGIGVNVAVM